MRASVPGRPRLHRVSVLIIALFIGFFPAAEAFCRYALPRLIEIEGRREQEFRAAVAPVEARPNVQRILVLGNSLLAQGVDFPGAQTEAGDGVELQRLVVEGTAYFDWLYGIKRLLADGARPNLIVLLLSPDQLAGNGIRGEYTAYRMMRSVDVAEASRRLGLNNTQAADLVLSNQSAYLGMRGNIRKRIMLAVNPGLRELMPLINSREPPHLDAQSMTQVAARRLAELSAATSAYGVRFALVVPPTNDPDAPAAAAAIQAAGREKNVAVLLPVRPGLFPADYYIDGFHLNGKGARIFTAKLAESLKTPLARLAEHEEAELPLQ